MREEGWMTGKKSQRWREGRRLGGDYRCLAAPCWCLYSGCLRGMGGGGRGRMKPLWSLLLSFCPSSSFCSCQLFLFLLVLSLLSVVPRYLSSVSSRSLLFAFISVHWSCCWLFYFLFCCYLYLYHITFGNHSNSFEASHYSITPSCRCFALALCFRICNFPFFGIVFLLLDFSDLLSLK